MAIRWDNVSGPSVAQAASSLGDAQKTFSGMFSGIDDILKKREAMESANWDQTKVNNTNAFLNATQEAKTPEEFAAREAMLREQLKGYGAQVDPMAARAALDGRMATLQQRGLATQQYTDQQVEVANRPVEAGYMGALAQVKTPEGVSGLMESMQAAVGAGAMDPRIFAKVMQQAQTRNTALVGEQRAAGTYERQGQDLESNIAHRANQDKIAREKLGIDRQQANLAQQRLTEDRAAREAASKVAQINAVTGQLKTSASLVENMNEATKVAQANPYAKPIDMSSGSPLLAAIDTQFGAKGQGADVLNKLSQTRFTMPVWSGEGKDRKITGYLPINPPQAVLDKALANVSNRWLEGITPKWRTADSVVTEVRNLLNDEGEVGNIQGAQRALGLAKDISLPGQEKTIPTPAEGAKAIIAGAKAATPPPPPSANWIDKAIGMGNRTPSVNKEGDMVFSRNGFDFSTESGVSAPKSVPMGALTTKVLDGDTLRITGEDGKSMNIRITGGDAQEIAHKGKEGQAGGTAGLEYLSNSLLNSGRTQLVFTDSKTDKNGRYIARLLVNGKDFTKAAIADGMMVPLDIGNSVGDQADNAALLKEAVKNGKGMFNNMDPKNILLPALNRATGQTKY